MNHIHKLKEHRLAHHILFNSRSLRRNDSAGNACKALDDFLTLRLYASANGDWIEKAFITRLWISTDKMIETTGVLDELQRTVAGLTANYPKPLTAAATHASQLVRSPRTSFMLYNFNVHSSYGNASIWNTNRETTTSLRHGHS